MWILFVIIVMADGSRMQFQIKEQWESKAVCEEKAEELVGEVSKIPGIIRIGTGCKPAGTPT